MRAKGTGCIMRSNDNKKWVAIIQEKDIETGNIKKKQIGTFQTKKEASDMLDEYCKTRNTPYGKKIFKDVAYDWYYRHVDGLSKSTIKHYYMNLQKMKPLYNYSVGDLNYEIIQRFIDNVNGDTRQTLAVLKLIFDEIEKNIDIKNYARMVKLPKQEKKIIRKVLKDEEINLLWEHQGEFIIDYTLILLYTGMRISELLNQDPNKIYLDKSYMIGGLKTDAGKNRVIPIHEKIKPIIKRYINTESKYLFYHDDKMLNYSTNYIHRLFKQFQRDLFGKEDDFYLIHDTRHTFTSRMARAKVDLYTIKRIIGHSIRDITEGIYIHCDEQDLIDAVNKLD